MGSKKDKRLLQSEKAIIEASIETLLANPSAGMSDIALAAGVGRATLYRHFESREVLIEKLILVCIEELEAASGPVHQLAGRAAIEAAIEVTVPLADRFHFLATLWTDEVDSEAIRQVNNRLDQTMASFIDQAKKAGEIDPALPTKWLVALHESTLMAAWWMIAAGDLTVDEAVGYVKRAFFSGCQS